MHEEMSVYLTPGSFLSSGEWRRDRDSDTRPGPRRHAYVYGLGAETPSRRRVTDDVFDMGVVRGRDRNSLSSLNLSFDIYPSP